MVIRVYLDKTIVDVLRCYGDLNKVVNQILTFGAEGKFEVMDKPTAPPRQNGKYYDIDVWEPEYLDMYDIYGSKSSRISLRRLLYWFVQNEMYDVLNMEVEKNYTSDNSQAVGLICAIRRHLQRLRGLIKNTDPLKEMTNILNSIETELWDE